MELDSEQRTAFIVGIRGAEPPAREDGVLERDGHGGVVALGNAKAALAYVEAIRKEFPKSAVGVLVDVESPVPILRAKALAQYAEPGQTLVTSTGRDLMRKQVVDSRFHEFGNVDLLGEIEKIYLLVPIETGEKPGRASGSSQPPGGPYIDREEDIANLESLMDLARVATLWGAPGMGKSALLRRFLAEVETKFDDQSHYLNLATVGHGDVLLEHVCQKVEAIRLPGESREDAILAKFREASAVLVIDNFDAVLKEVADLVMLLVESCPDLAIVLGSRTPIGLPIEQRQILKGLAYPAAFEDWRAIGEYPAVMLFEDRARRVDPRFQISSKNAKDVAEICRRLDGNPLAIELLAAKSLVMTPRQLLTNLSDPRIFRDKSGKNPLAEILDLAAGSISSAAQVLLNRLTVFRGAFTVEWVADVCQAAPLTPESMEFLVYQLAESSWLSVEESPGQDKLFHLSGLTRDHFAQKLSKDKEDHSLTMAAYRQWTHEFATRAVDGLFGDSQAYWLHLLDASYGDMRFVIDEGCLPRRDLRSAAVTLLACHHYLLERNYFREGLNMAEKILGTRGANKVPEYKRILNMASVYAYFLGDDRHAFDYALKCLRLSRRERDHQQEARAWCSLGMAAQKAAGKDLRFPSREEKLQKKARLRYLRAARLLRKLHDKNELAAVLGNLIGVTAHLCKLEEAWRYYQEAARLLSSGGIVPATVAHVRLLGAHTALLMGNYRDAAAPLVEGLELYIALEDKLTIGLGMRTAARFAYQGRHYDVAAIAIGQSFHLLEQCEIEPIDSSPHTFIEVAAKVEMDLGHERFEELVERGRDMEPDEVLEMVKRIADELPPA